MAWRSPSIKGRNGILFGVGEAWNKNLENLTRIIISPLFTSMVHPHLEYCRQVWSSKCIYSQGKTKPEIKVAMITIRRTEWFQHKEQISKMGLSPIWGKENTSCNSRMKRDQVFNSPPNKNAPRNQTNCWCSGKHNTETRSLSHKMTELLQNTCQALAFAYGNYFC